MKKNRNRNRNRNSKRRGVARSLRDNHSPKRRAIALRIDKLEAEIEEINKFRSGFTEWFYSTEQARKRFLKQWGAKENDK